MSRVWVERVDEELKRAHKQIRRQQDVIATLQTHNIRLARKDAGLSEDHRSERKKEEADVVPEEVRRYIDSAFDSPEMRANVEDDIAMARAQGTPWTEILRVISIEMEGDNVQP